MPGNISEFGSTSRERAVTRVVSFTGGKGGVGKTSAVVNVGIALSHAGRRVLILDADLGLANVDVMLGIKPRATLYDMLKGRRDLSEIMVDGPGGVSIIPAASGVESMGSLSAVERQSLLAAVEQVAARFDYLLIDTQAGISSQVMFFNAAASEIVCVINDEPTSLTDAYALIKVLSRNYAERSISVVVNNVATARDAQLAFGRLERAAARHLQVKLRYVGFVPSDRSLREAVGAQRAVLDLFPSSPSSRGFAKVAETIDESFHERRVKGGMQLFFNQLLEMSHG